MNKPIILIQGTSGAGKTTLAKELVRRYDLDHRLGTGFVREIIRSETSKEECPYLFNFTYQAEDPVEHLSQQARRLTSAIFACIGRAKKEGTSLVIEGNHMLPEIFHSLEDVLYLVLTNSNRESHFENVNGPTHAHRDVTSEDFEKVLKIDSFLIAEAKKYEVPIVDNQNIETAMVEIGRLLYR